MGVASSLLQFRVCCLGLRNPWSEMQAPSRQGHVGTASSAGACALHADHATEATPSVSIIHGMHDKMLSRREWHCTCEWHFWRALALSQQPGRSSPSRALLHVAPLRPGAPCHGPVQTRVHFHLLEPVWFTSYNGSDAIFRKTPLRGLPFPFYPLAVLRAL